MRDRFCAAVWLAVSAGCAEATLADVEPGIYALRVETIADECTPTRPAGDFIAAVAIEEDRLVLHVPLAGSPAPIGRLVLDQDLDLETTEDVAVCEGAVVRRRVHVTDVGQGDLRAAISETYAGLSQCVPSEAVAPSADCHALRSLVYHRRIMECLPPCNAAVDDRGASNCACP